MEIKFNIGDEVYILRENEIHKCVIFEIKSTFKLSEYISRKTTRNIDEITYRLLFIDDFNDMNIGWENLHKIYMPQNLVFDSLEDIKKYFDNIVSNRVLKEENL